MEKGSGISRKEAVVTGVLGTLVVLGLLAGLGWLIHAIFTQPVSTPAVNISGDNSSANQSLTDSSAAADRQAARRRAAEQVALADVSSGKAPQAANAARGVAPVDIGSGAGQSNSVHLPEVVKLDGLDAGNSPPQRVKPVDLSGIAGASQNGVAPANMGGSNSSGSGVSPVEIAQNPGGDYLPKPVTIGPTRPSAEDNLAPPELRSKIKSINRLCRDNQGNIWVGTEEALLRFSPGKPADQQWTQMAIKELAGDGVSALAMDRLGRIWVGTCHSGLLVYNGQDWAQYEIIAGVTHPDSRSGPIGQHAFHISVNPASGEVWIATEGGLSRYSEKSDSWSYFTRSEGLPCDHILGMAFAPSGDIYCASDCNGLIMAAAADGYIWMLS